VTQGQSYPINFLRQDNSWQDPFVNNLTPTNPSYPYSSIFTALFAALGLTRTLLKVATTFYIATNGSDANNGLTPATAWLTFAHAMAVITGQYDFGGQAVMLQANAGHANFTTTLSILPWVGGGSLTYDGGGGTFNTTAADNISTANAGVLPGPLKLQNITFGSMTSGNGITHTSYGLIILGPGLVFGVCPNSIHIKGGGFARYQKQAGFTINGSAANHIQMGIGLYDGETFSTTDTISGGLTFGAFFFVAGSGATCLVDGVTYPATGAYQTGNVSNNGILHAAGRTLPGNGVVVQGSGGQFS
jgi:hypothetical protein